jgi:hypothetical protein
MSYVSVEAISVAVVRAHARGPRRNCTVRTDLASASYLNADASALQFHRPLLPVTRR